MVQDHNVGMRSQLSGKPHQSQSLFHAYRVVDYQ